MILELSFKRDDDKVLKLDGNYKNDAFFGITSLAGIGEIKFDYKTESLINEDDFSIIGSNISKRSIDIEAIVKNSKNNDFCRQNVLSFFRKNHNYKLYVKKDKRILWIECIPEKIQCKIGKEKENAKLKLSLMCPNPFFNSFDDFGKDLAQINPLFVFPYKKKMDEMYPISSFQFSKEITVYNLGDTYTYPKVIITAHGDVKNPIVNVNNAYIKLIDNLKEGDVIEIAAPLKIIKNGQNCIRYVDKKSNFIDFKLNEGINKIGYNAEDGDSNMSAKYFYFMKYNGA